MKSAGDSFENSAVNGRISVRPHRVGHQFGPPVVRGEQRRMAAGADYLAGVRVEGDDDGRHAQFAGPLHGPPDDQLVSAVHAVVGADGDDAASPVLGGCPPSHASAAL